MSDTPAPSPSIAVGSLFLEFNQRTHFATEAFRDQFVPLCEEELHALKKGDEAYVAIGGGRTGEKISGKVKVRVLAVRRNATEFKLFYESYLHADRRQTGSLVYPQDADKFFKAKDENRLARICAQFPLSQRLK